MRACIFTKKIKFLLGETVYYTVYNNYPSKVRSIMANYVKN